MESKRRIHLRQSVMLSGLGTDTFNDAISSINSFQTLLAAHIPAQSMIHWAPSSFQEFKGIDISNRYFCRKRDTSEASISFGVGIDPHGTLTGLLQDDLMHTSENEVLYYQRLPGDSPDAWRYVLPFLNMVVFFFWQNIEHYRYEEVSPARFQTGHIVEAQFSLVLVPLRGRMHKMMLVLRSLALLDSQQTKVSLTHFLYIFKFANMTLYSYSTGCLFSPLSSSVLASQQAFHSRSQKKSRLWTRKARSKASQTGSGSNEYHSV